MWSFISSLLTKRMKDDLNGGADLYERLSYLEAVGNLTSGQLSRLLILKKAFGPQITYDKNGDPVASMGSRESQINRQRQEIIRRMVLGTSMPTDEVRLNRLGAERTARLMPRRFRRLLRHAAP
jgi:hypothetical protein